MLVTDEAETSALAQITCMSHGWQWQLSFDKSGSESKVAMLMVELEP